MILHTGRVLRVDGELAWVECIRGGPCALCPGRAGCELAFGGEPRPHRLRAVTRRRDLAPGTEVQVAIAPGAVLRAALLAYGLPLAGLLCGAGLGSALAPAMELLGACVGLAGGTALAGAASRRLRGPPPLIVEPVERS